MAIHWTKKDVIKAFEEAMSPPKEQSLKDKLQQAVMQFKGK